MSTYSIGSDSPRWWWPSAAVGAVGAAAITAILVLPSTGTTLRDQPVPREDGGTVGDPWHTTVDPAVGRQCFALRPRWETPVLRQDPLCGHRGPRQPYPGNDGRRPGLDSRP